MTTKTVTSPRPVHKDRQAKPVLIVLGVLFILAALAGFAFGAGLL